MRINVIYLSINITRDNDKYLKGEILTNYPIDKYKVWFVDRSLVEMEQFLSQRKMEVNCLAKKVGV